MVSGEGRTVGTTGLRQALSPKAVAMIGCAGWLSSNQTAAM